jgi:hypothetical protein
MQTFYVNYSVRSPDALDCPVTIADVFEHHLKPEFADVLLQLKARLEEVIY